MKLFNNYVKEHFSEKKAGFNLVCYYCLIIKNTKQFFAKGYILFIVKYICTYIYVVKVLVSS